MPKCEVILARALSAQGAGQTAEAARFRENGATEAWLEVEEESPRMDLSEATASSSESEARAK